jgi:hypothetical protein
LRRPAARQNGLDVLQVNRTKIAAQIVYRSADHSPLHRNV